MSWFKRKEPQTVRAPFPLERVAALRTIFDGAIGRGIRLRQSPHLSHNEVLESSFFNAYVCGYCHHLDEQNHQLGAAVRAPLIALIFQASDVETQARFDLFKLLYERRDRTAVIGGQLGAADGSIYFTALTAGEDADESSVANLILAIRGRDDFHALTFPL